MADTPDLPPPPSHPDSHTMAWTDREKAAIADYAREAVRLAARASVPAAIERDESMNRDYIPLPGGWELQTKGNGSTLRLVDTKTGERHGLPVGAEHIIRFIERMGMEIHAASTPTPPDEASDALDAARYRKAREMLTWQIKPDRCATKAEVDSYIDSIAARTQGDGA